MIRSYAKVMGSSIDHSRPLLQFEKQTQVAQTVISAAEYRRSESPAAIRRLKDWEVQAYVPSNARRMCQMIDIVSKSSSLQAGRYQ